MGRRGFRVLAKQPFSYWAPELGKGAHLPELTLAFSGWFGGCHCGYRWVYSREQS